MTINNKLDQSFGPVGTSAGMILFVVGLILTYSHFTGLILVLIGAFVGFSSTSTFIDYDKKRVRFSNNLFGIIRTGKWINIDPSMKIGIKDSNITWRAYSMGNRALDITSKDFRIILLDAENKEIMPVNKAKTYDSAKIICETFRDQLGLIMI
jgi:hypothetical protein